MITVRDAFAQAFAKEAAGRFAEARAVYEEILAAIPDHPGALLKIAEDEQRGGRLDSARGLLERALRAAPGQGLPLDSILTALGRVALLQGDSDAARRSFERVRDLGHATPELLAVLAWLALQRGDAPEAIAQCRSGLAAHPGHAELLHQLGKSLHASGRLAEAREALGQAVAASTDDPRLRVWLGAVCLEQGFAAEARGQFARAIELGQNTAEDWDNLGRAHQQLGEMDEAVGAFERAITLDPDGTPALSNLLETLRLACRWEDAERREREWLAGLDQPGRDPRWRPFLGLLLATTPAQQLWIARQWSAHTLPPVQSAALIKARGDRLRVAYLSSAFRVHPTSTLIAGHIEGHDRRRFETFGYSHGPRDDSAIRRRVQAGFEHWVEARAMSDAQLAQRIRDDRIDVLIELDGHTQGQRLPVLALRPAPVQLHYLGFPGTLGFDGIDGVIADAVVAPPEDDRHFHERVLRLPRCYQVNDRGRGLPPPTPRATLGIADDALVLACFNRVDKITRAFFHGWMDVLARVPRALLWLYVPSRPAQANIRAEAHRRGIERHRIVFATTADQHEHIARLRSVDLSLDVAPYNSHTTGSDSLWAGVPMLSCKGSAFAGRVGESLLAAVGLRELVLESHEAYRAELLALATDRDRLRGYHEHLERERLRLPLFDTEGFTRDFEALLIAACDDAATDRAAGTTVTR